MYKYKDYNYSLEEVQDAADKEKLSIDEYIKEFNIEKTDPDPDEEGKKTPSQETVDATVKVSDTASKSETSSLELANPKLTNFEAYEDFVSTPSKVTPEGQIELRQRKREDVSEEIFDPVELEEVVVTGEKIETDAADALVKLEIEDYRSPAEKLVKRLAEGVEPQDPATMSTARSIYNTTINALNQLSSVDEKAEFLGAFISSDIDLIYNIFGEKAGKKILKENQKRLSKASKRFDEINSYSLPTIGFTDIPERKGFTGKLGGGVAGALNALSAFGTSIAISAPTFGVGLASDMIAGSVKTFNDNKAARLGISFDELIKQGKGDLFVPAALGVFGYGLERAGIKGVSNSINAMSNPAKKGLYSLLNAGGKEGTTEYLQGGVEVFNEALGQGKNIDEAGNVVFNYLTSKEGFENLLQGAFGGVGMSAGGRFVKAASAIKTPAENQEIANLVTEYSSLEDQKYKRSLTQEERDILIKSQDNIKIQLTSQIKKNNVLVASMNENQIDNINNNLDLIRSIQKQERAINESGNLSEEAKASALNQLQKDKKLAQDQIFNERNQAERRAANINKIKQLAETEQNLEIQDFATTAEVEQYLKENNIAKGQTKKAANQQGFFVQRPGQKDLIVINRQQSNKDNAVNVAAHEYLHYILSKMIAKDSEAANKLGKSLDQYLNKIDSEQIESSQFKQRLEQYKNLPEAERNEEVLALFSDALAQGDLKFDTNIFTNIGDATRRFFQDLGVGIKFNKGKDVFNFIRDYNKSVEEARLTEAQRKLIEADDSSAVKQAEEVIKESRSEEASNKVQEIYEEKGINGALEIIEQFKPITNKIVEQRKNAPGFDRQLLTDEIETGAGGILDLIQAYDPASNVPLAAYINKFLPVRAITASRRILEEEFAGDIAEAPQVAAEAAPEVEAEVTPAKAKKQVKKETLSAENQQALEDVVADLELTEDELTFKTLPNAAIEVFAKQIGIPAKKFAGSSNFTQAELGKVISFIEENIDLIRQVLPEAAVLEGAPVSESLIGTATGVPNNVLKNINLYERLARGTKKAGLIAYKKLKGINNDSILKAIGIIDGKRTAGPRDKQAQTAKGLINVLAKFATNQEVRLQKNLTPQQKTDIETGKGSAILFSLSKPDQTLLSDFGIEAYPMEKNTDVDRYINDIKQLASIFNTNDYKLLNSSVLQFPDKIIKDTKVAEYLRVQLAQLKKDKILAARVTEGRTKPTQAIGNTVEKFIKSITSGKLAAYNKKHSKVFDKMWKDINQAIKENPDLAIPITYFLSNSINEPTNPHRMGAPIIGYEPGSKKLYYEHAMQSTNAYRALMRAILTDRNNKETSPTFDKEFKRVKKNYFIIAISPENNTKLDKAGYKNAFDDSWTNWWQRYFNSKVAAINGGIDPNNIIFIKENGTGKISFGEELGINSEGKEVKGQQALSKSISKAAAKNNKKLPKSLQLEGALTNAEVLTRMQELDDKASEARKQYSKSQRLNEDFNDIIEAKTGIATYKRFSPAKAEVRGASKGKFNFFIPPSAEDFIGLIYKTLAKGKVGDRQMQWYKDNLLNPYARAMNDISAARVAMFEDYKTLKNDLKIIPKNLKKKGFDEYTKEQAVRTYIWNEQGNNIPGLFKTDQKELVDYVNNSPELKLFADQLIAIQKGDQYSAPKEGWLNGTITTDLLDSVNSIKRKKYLEQWQTNVDEIFSEENMNKLEAAFGKPYRKALENILQRMKTGRNKPFTSDSLAGRFTDWLNNSVGAIMFFNTRSAVLQTLSSINFINWSDNNLYKAGKAFANQPQYWKDFKFLFNSDFLKERRGGLRFNVSESEIAEAATKGGARGVVSKILQAGFLPTQMADSFAIASGGATFYRNRIKSYIKQGLTEADAQEKALQDFREIAEESQQSSRPDRISAQQAGPLGRTILAFANTPAQYARLTKKAASDLINGRGDAKTNISKLIYYGAVQNLIFNMLQKAVFALAFGDDDEDEKKKEEKYLDVANGMADGLLRGIGVYGAIASTLKNTLMRIIKESEKSRPDYAETAVIQLLGVSPPVQSKAQKIRSAFKSYEWNKDEMRKKGFSLDNPAYMAGANVISASVNVPLDRVIKKVDNVRNSTREDITGLQRMMLIAGWSEWELGIQQPKPKKTRGKQRKIRTRGKQREFKTR